MEGNKEKGRLREGSRGKIYYIIMSGNGAASAALTSEQRLEEWAAAYYLAKTGRDGSAKGIRALVDKIPLEMRDRLEQMHVEAEAACQRSRTFVEKNEGRFLRCVQPGLADDRRSTPWHHVADGYHRRRYIEGFAKSICTLKGWVG